MSTDKTASWADHLLAAADPSGTGSATPSDDFTWTEGSNYGLDGFHHDQTLGEGLKNNGDQSGLSGPITPAQTSGMSDLPDGLMSSMDVVDDTAGLALMDDTLDLSGMLGEEEGEWHMTAATRKAASLADLNWLDPTQEPDPERIPKELRPDQPPLNSVPELEEAWGVNRRTDGLRLIPNNDKAIADYEKSIESGVPATPGVGKNADDASWHIKKAVRMSHYGRPMAEIGRYLAANVGGEQGRQATDLIASEHGVAGRVFVRASAFPGLRNGKWAKEIKKFARTARYVITDNPTVASKLSMEMVASVPWKRALREYAPYLKGAGYKVAALSTAKKTLQLAFLTGPAEVEHVANVKPVDVRPADTITVEAAKAAAKAAPKQARVVITHDDTAKARKAVLKLVGKAARAGLISKADAVKLGESKAAPAEIKLAAERIARANQMPKVAEYGGLGTKVTAYRQQYDQAWASLRQAEVDSSQMRKAVAHVRKMAKAGQITLAEAKAALEQSDPKQVLKHATAYANSSGTRKEAMPKAAAAKEYGGHAFKQAHQNRVASKQLSASETQMRSAAKAAGIKVSEFRKLGTWVRRQMSEGMAGKDLSDMMRFRFAAPLREAAAEWVQSLRDEHEGLSGHLYVDAAAYASKTGTKGCEAAASKHRANQVRFVRAMERCSGCVFANANSVCNKYGKELLHEVPSDSESFRQQMLHMADAPDEAITASLFNVAEFNLSNPLESLTLDGEPDPELSGDLDGVVFGGMEF